jgi:uncharacterized damage-inducible protein DinB
MRNYEFFAAKLEQEIPIFVKVLRALPEDKLDYRPHEKNTPAGALAWQMTTEMESLIQLFDNNGVIDYRVGPDRPSVAVMADRMEAAGKAAVERAKKTDENVWRGPGKFLFNGHVAWEATVADLAWGFLFDLIHHRGQMSAYLRPMGAKVPAIYGPSADEAE